MSEQTTHPDTMACDCAAMSQRTEAHAKLEPFVGTFTSQVKMWMGPGEPMESTGTMVNEWDLGERFLKQTYTADPNDGPFPDFEGRGYFGFNTATNKYEGFWIDSASTMMQTEAGDLDAAGRRWEMSSEMPDPSSGKTMTKRSVCTVIDDDHHTLEMYFTMPDGNEMKCMEIAYTRVK
jgi:hypothetical protein